MRGFTDHPQRSLPPAGAQLWDSLYHRANSLYGAEWGPHVADKVTRDLWAPTGRRRQGGFRQRLPNPENTIMCGFALDVHYLCPHGRIAVRRFTRSTPNIRERAHLCGPCSSVVPNRFGVPCLWSPGLKAVLVFPSMPVPRATLAATNLPELLEVYRSFHAGREPKDGASKVGYPEAVFSQCRPAIAESYTSDKFDDEGQYVDYIHHNDRGSNGAPGPQAFISSDCVMVRGGRLNLTSRGLVH